VGKINGEEGERDEARPRESEPECSLNLLVALAPSISV